MDNASGAAFFSIEAEQSVLGALMISEAAWDEISDTLAPADFYRLDHRLIFAAARRLAESGKPRDAVTMAATLEEFHELQDAGGMQYLGELIKNTASAHNVRAYADVIRKRSQLRDLCTAINAGGDLIHDPEIEISDKIARITEKLESVLAGDGETEGKSARDATSAWIDSLNAKFRAGSTITGVRTGLAMLTRAT